MTCPINVSRCGRGVILALVLAFVQAATAAEPPLLLAATAPADVDPSRYWVSEKLDGVRAFWDGRRLRLRGGGVVAVPAWYVARFPVEPLDGELWIARGRFEQVSGIVRRRQGSDDDWRQVRYMVFELPGGAGDFSERLRRLRALVADAGVPWLQGVEQRRVTTRHELAEWLERVLAAGGEGLMLHRADAPYVTGRSDVLLKLKPWYDDDATVVGYVAGRGRLVGRVGALVVEARDGRRFRLGSGLDDSQRATPPAIGSLVSYRYRSLTEGGLPRFPVFWRVRQATQSMPGRSGAGASSTSR
ncbi:MAG: DNA ligase [Zoogloeaceae bacterium]|nr:DNA ligase [Rhodocyclaceae bacterium]MCP5234478.1 DNA ligase [Zoogloeaceae bacterium]